MLVVDDDVRTARLLVRMLRDDGFETELAVDGAAAIARLNRLPHPDALVTDFRLPHVDGVTVAKFARSVEPRMAVFVVTSYAELVGDSNTVVPDAVMFPKPLDYASLAARIREAVGKSTVV